MEYLTVGINEIKSETFRKVMDTEATNIKPKGGLWFTRYENNHYNEWVDFILENPVLLYYKSKGESIWKQPCSLVTLNDSANIFMLDNKKSMDYLKERFPLDDNKFSYQEMSHYYDGIFVDYYKLLCEIEDPRLYKFGVNSLNLFNVDCIDYYKSGVVDIVPFDFEYGNYETSIYEIKLDNEKKKVLKK